MPFKEWIPYRRNSLYIPLRTRWSLSFFRWFVTKSPSTAIASLPCSAYLLTKVSWSSSYIEESVIACLAKEEKCVRRIQKSLKACHDIPWTCCSDQCRYIVVGQRLRPWVAAVLFTGPSATLSAHTHYGVSVKPGAKLNNPKTKLSSSDGAAKKLQHKSSTVAYG